MMDGMKYACAILICAFCVYAFGPETLRRTEAAGQDDHVQQATVPLSA